MNYLHQFIILILLAHNSTSLSNLMVLRCIISLSLLYQGLHVSKFYELNYSLLIKPAIPKANNPRVPNPARHVYLIILFLFRANSLAFI